VKFDIDDYEQRAARLDDLHVDYLWGPVGSSVMPAGEVRHLCRFRFDGSQGRAVVARIDRRIDRLPGLQDLGLLEQAAERHS
jgi:hypothetical protein